MRRAVPTLFAVLALSQLALAAQPKQLNIPVGYTTTLTMPSPVSKVTVVDDSLVEVSRHGRRIAFLGLKKGRTEVTVWTADGKTELSIYVPADKYGRPF